MLVGQFGNVEMMSARGARGERIRKKKGRNDGCRRVHDLRDSRVKRAFPPRSSAGLILADTLSIGFIRFYYAKTNIVSLFFLTYTLILRNIGETLILINLPPLPFSLHTTIFFFFLFSSDRSAIFTGNTAVSRPRASLLAEDFNLPRSRFEWA